MAFRQSLMQYAQKYGVSRASRKYNKSRSYIYFWKKRWDGSVASLACASRRPHSHPNQHTEDELKLIRDMRRRNPTLGMLELWHRLRQRGYSRCPESLFRVMRKLGLFPAEKPKKKFFDSRVLIAEFAAVCALVALILLSNKIRAEAPDTFKYFAEQGVAIKVISGDNAMAVSEVAKRAGIRGAESYVDARTLETDEDIAAAVEKYTVFGRVTPDQKRRFVRALKAAGHTVAMTGDGVNDVLALKEADCSIAMASGSDAASQVSHIVLLESNFAAMPSVVAEGRRVINNIERSAALFLVKNIFSFALAVISLIFTLPYPVTSAQMSLVSALTIGAPGFVLAMEPNTARIKGKFLPNVIYRALPGGLTDLILVLGVILFCMVFKVGENMMSTVCAIILNIVGLMVVHYTCKPYNLLRKAMMTGLTVAFVFCVLLLPQLFTLTSLDLPGAMILVVFALLSAPALMVIRRAQDKLKSGIDSLRSPGRHAGERKVRRPRAK